MFGAFAIRQFACSLQKARRMHHAVWQCMRISVFCGDSHIIIKTEEKSRAEYCFGIQHSAKTLYLKTLPLRVLNMSKVCEECRKLGTLQ